MHCGRHARPGGRCDARTAKPSYSKPDLPDCSLLTQFGDMRGLGGAAHALLQQAKLALGVIAKKPGSGTANTALVYHARKLMALHEGDLPYAVRLAELVGQGVRVWGAGVCQMRLLMQLFMLDVGLGPQQAEHTCWAPPSAPLP